MTRTLLIVCLLLSGLLGWSQWSKSRISAARDAALEDLRDAQHALDAARAAINAQRAAADRLADIGSKHEQDRRDAEGVPDAVVADLRAGNLRLRREWAGCETRRLSDAAAAARERDALAASRDALAGAVVRVGRDADDQLAACQAVVIAQQEACREGGM